MRNRGAYSSVETGVAPLLRFNSSVTESPVEEGSTPVITELNGFLTQITQIPLTKMKPI